MRSVRFPFSNLSVVVLNRDADVGIMLRTCARCDSKNAESMENVVPVTSPWLALECETWCVHLQSRLAKGAFGLIAMV